MVVDDGLVSERMEVSANSSLPETDEVGRLAHASQAMPLEVLSHVPGRDLEHD